MNKRAVEMNFYLTKIQRKGTVKCAIQKKHTAPADRIGCALAMTLVYIAPKELNLIDTSSTFTDQAVWSVLIQN
jgi:hypothetical protein